MKKILEKILKAAIEEWFNGHPDHSFYGGVEMIELLDDKYTRIHPAGYDCHPDDAYEFEIKEIAEDSITVSTVFKELDKLSKK